MLEIALDFSQRSVVEGVALYDPTILPVADLWDITNRQYNYFDNNYISDEELPEEGEIAAALALVDYRDVIIDKEESTVFLKNEGMKIDLGSIVKGYAADKIKAYLLDNGYNKAVIDIGRNILTVGSFVNADLEDTPWKIGIQRPFASIFDRDYEETEIIGILRVTDLSLVTSGIYEKYILTDSGKRYHHIFDPRTGYPMNNNVASVTVICEESVIADALSTTLFLLGIEKAMEMIDGLDFNVETIWVLQSEEPGIDYEIYVSQDWKTTSPSTTKLKAENMYIKVCTMRRLEIKNLHTTADDFEILKGVNLVIKTGEVHAVMGPNGTGKSTLASTIMGYYKYQVSAGDILLDDESILPLTVDERSRRGIFLAMQHPYEISGITNADFIKAALQARDEGGRTFIVIPLYQAF